MKYKILFPVLFGSILMGLLSCGKTETVATVNDPSFGEEFDTLSKAINRGWVIANNSKPIGTMAWVQAFYYVSIHHSYDDFGKVGINNPYIGGFNGVTGSYSGTDFVMTTSNCGHGTAQLSNWLISPAVTMKNGDEISFYTRTYSFPAIAADRLEVRLNVVDGSADVGHEATSIGNFTEVLLDVNPNYELDTDDAYPGEWTQYTATVTGLPTAKKARVAFRYWVPDGGPDGNNSLGIGIDKFNFLSK